MIQQRSHIKFSCILYGKKISLTLLDDEDFTIPYVINKTLHSPAVHKILTQAKKKVWIISINGENTITSQGA